MSEPHLKSQLFEPYASLDLQPESKTSLILVSDAMPVIVRDSSTSDRTKNGKPNTKSIEKRNCIVMFKFIASFILVINLSISDKENLN